MNTLPLLVYVAFHPESAAARRAAEHLRTVLNSDPVLPGLRVPVRFCPEDGTGLPPVEELSAAGQRVMIIALCDTLMAAGPDAPVPAGRRDWAAWVYETWAACQGREDMRCIPFQWDDNGWPLDERLCGVNFPRAFAVPEEQRAGWVEQRLVIEMVRFLLGAGAAENHDVRAPLQVFLSHTKLDVDQEPRVFRSVLDYLKQDQPVDAWVDAGDIPGGSQFGREIEEGVKKSAVLVLLTDAYASREWCRREVLLAKEHQRPVVVVEAVRERESRSFPYLGNVPVLNWSGQPGAAVHLLLKETLRHLVCGAELKRAAQPGDVILTSPPELASVVGRGTVNVLYPDPPLAEEECALIRRSGVTAETPLQRFASQRPLRGMKIAVSLSESPDTARYGLCAAHLDEAALEISRYLLLAGATLCYGGHLGSDGYTVQLFELVRSYPLPGIEPVERVVNHVGWPLPLTAEARAKYKFTATFIRTGRPAGITEADGAEFDAGPQKFFPDDSPVRRLAWALGMTAMRRQQTAEVDARIVLGGASGPVMKASAGGGQSAQWYKSRIPGVLEESLCSLDAGQPLFLAGGFGGCARLVADVLQGLPREEMTWDYQKAAPHAPAMRDLYAARGLPWRDYPEMAAAFQQAGAPGLRNGLTPEENAALFTTPDPREIVALLLRGLTAVRAAGAKR